MPDQSAVIVPPDLQKQFPELIALVLGSESMNDEERQYWINILPAMTPEQQQNLLQILKNEKDQLAAIDAKYAKEMESAEQGRAAEEIEIERRKKRTGRKKMEQETETEEKQKEEEILKAISDLGSK